MMDNETVEPDSLVDIHVVQKLYGHVSDVSCCDFSGNKLVTCSTDKTVRIWNIQNELQYVEALHSPLFGHKYGILSCSFSSHGTRLATASIDGNVILWNIQTGVQEAVLKHPSQLAVRACKFSPNSLYLATGGEDYLILLWNVQTHDILCTLSAHEDIVSCLAFTPDDAFLISGSSDCTLELWRVQNRTASNVFCLKDVHDLGVVSCDFSSKMSLIENGLSIEYLLATCGNDDFVNLWKAICGIKHEITLLYRLEGHSANVMCCRFSPNGYLLASVSGDKSVILWDPKCGFMLKKKTEHSRYITSCAFSGDSSILVTGSNDKSVIVWKICTDTPATNALGYSIMSNVVETSHVNVASVTGDSSSEHSTSQYETALNSYSNVLRVNLDQTCGSSNVKEMPNLIELNENHFSKWSTKNVCDWLESVNLSEYKQVFSDNEIDGQELLYLTHHTLETKLKIAPFGHRNRILRGVTLLKNPSSSAYIQLEIEDSSIPEEYFCPITQQIMRDPVIAADGHSYERNAISEWFLNGKTTSPMTNEKLCHQNLIPNHLLKSLIKRYS